MAQFFVQLPAGDIIALDLDLDTTTAAATKARVNARLESEWRASEVRTLRSDLPFRGITLSYQNRHLATDQVFSKCEIREGWTLYPYWLRKSETDGKRKKYGKGWDNEPVMERMIREKREVKRARREEKSMGNKALRGAARKVKVTSAVEEDTTESAPGIGGDEVIPSKCVSDYRSGDKTEVGAKADCADASGEPGLSEALADEDEGEQQAEEGDEEIPTGDVERHDPFADEDDNKEDREPPIVEPRVDDYPAEEWPIVDESSSGLGVDLLEEVFDF